MNSLNPANWVDAYTDYLYSLALLKTGHQEDAQDIVQETFLSAFRAREGFKGESSEKTWLTAILKNKLVDYFRRKNARQPLSAYLLETTDAFQQAFFDEGNFGRFKSPIRPNYFSNNAEEYLSGQEFQKILEECILKMPVKLRSVFVAKYMDEAESENICKEHDLSSSNYWVIVHRSKVLLRACLEKQGII